MTNILVTGSNGQLGLELKKVSKEYPNYKFLFSDIDSLDITDFDAVRHFIIHNKIEVILMPAYMLLIKLRITLN